MNPLLRALTFLAVGLAARTSTAALGEPTPDSVVSSEGKCPMAEAVWSAVVGMVPRSDLSRIASGTVSISDQGDSYKVVIRAGGNESVHVYRDAERSCEHRARVAAVFVVLTLAPPDLLPDSRQLPPPPPPQPPAPPAVVPTPPPPPVAAPEPHRFRVELSSLVDAAPAYLDAPGIVALGGELRAVWGAGRMAAVAAAGFEPRATFELDGLTARQMRVPFDIGGRLSATHWSWATLSGELSLAGAWFRATATNTAAPRSESRLDLGARAGVMLRVGGPDARFSPVLGVHTIFFPRQYDVTLTPQGEIGHTPALWLGATAGVSYSP